MYYQFNNFTGRITGSRNIQPYFPIGVQPLDRSEPPTIIFGSKKEKFASTSTSVHQAAEKTVSGSDVKYGSLNPTLKRKMEIFQKPSNVPIFLKGGALDRGLYGLTLVLCGVGIVGCGHFIYTQAVPK